MAALQEPEARHSAGLRLRARSHRTLQQERSSILPVRLAASLSDCASFCNCAALALHLQSAWRAVAGLAARTRASVRFATPLRSRGCPPSAQRLAYAWRKSQDQCERPPSPARAAQEMRNGFLCGKERHAATTKQLGLVRVSSHTRQTSLCEEGRARTVVEVAVRRVPDVTPEAVPRALAVVLTSAVGNVAMAVRIRNRHRRQ